MIELGLVLLILFIGLIGWVSYCLFFHSGASQESSWMDTSMNLFLSGLGTVSVILLAATMTGWFHRIVLLGAAGVLFLFYVLRKQRRAIPYPFSWRRYLIFCLLLAVTSLGVAKLTRPYEAIICGSDASVYIASAFQLADSGSLRYTDSVVLEMTEQEREMFHFEEQNSYIRFRAGVHLVDPEKGIVGFSFFPLFPAWLGLGLHTLGPHGFLYLLSFFTVLGMFLLFLIGKKVAGPWIGFSIPLVLFFFYPQFYFSRMPWSEILSQTLFFSGLWAFTKNGSAGQQRLSAVLWGSMFLCRIDMLFFLAISLVLLFTVHPAYSTKWREWRSFLLGMILFLCCTFCWQLISGSYLNVWGLNQLTVMNVLWVPLVSYLSNFLTVHPFPGAVVFAGVTAGLLVLLNFLLRQQAFTLKPRLKMIVGLLVTGSIIFSLIGSHLDWNNLLLRTSWALVYTPPFVVVVFFSGFAAFLYTQLKQPKSILPWILLVMLIPTAVFYLARPLITLHQPLFIRRFVPVVFPLFFLLSISGWDGFLQKMLRRALLARLLFVALILSITGTFLAGTLYLLKEPVFADLIEQAERIAGRIPADALVVIPRADEGIYMEMPLQYMMKLETVSTPEAEKEYLLDSFLQRQLKKNRPVFVLSLTTANSASQLLYNFALEPEFTDDVFVNIVPQVDAWKFPDRNEHAVLQYRADRLLPRALPAVRKEILYDDREVSFINFHIAESGFRWTKESSEVGNFTYETEGKDIRLILITNELIQGLDWSGLDVRVNGNISARLVKRESSEFHFQIDGRFSRITSVTIRTRTFVPKQLGINNDPRTLGIPFAGLRFVRE